MFRLPFFSRVNGSKADVARVGAYRCVIEPLEVRALFAGSGLSGAYFNSVDLTAKVLARTDSQISFDWSSGAPASGVGSDYSVRWSGRVQARFTEQYRFATLTAGGVRLWIDNELVIDNWTSHALRSDSGYATLAAGKRYSVRMEYQNTGGPATARLYWESARQTKQIIPKGYLYSSDVDSAAPTNLSNVRATYVTDKTITIGWDAASDPSTVVYYDVYIGKTKLGTTSETTWTRAGRSPNTAYNWTVVAVDPSGNASAGKSVMVTTLAAPVSAGGLGLAAKYYSGEFTRFISTRTDGAIDFNWSSAPITTTNNQFSVKWEGSLVPYYSEAYTLYFTSDDGVRVWIDNALVINHWEDHAAAEDRATLSLTGGRQYAIRIQYQNSGGPGVAKFEWSSQSQIRQVVPASQMIAAFTDNAAPSMPTNVRVTSVTASAVNLAWDASTDDVGVFGYDVYRGSTKVATVQTPQFSDSGLTAGTQYQYKVVAIDGVTRKSAASSAVSVTTSPAPTVRDALNPIGAATYDTASGVTKSGNNVTSFGDNDWMEYSNVNFRTGVNSVRITLAAATTNLGGNIELRLDSKNGALIGTMVVQPTGSFVTYLTQKTQISGANGTHSLFLVGRNVSAVANVQTIQFSTKQLIKIMPLGDSITQSFGDRKSYRYYLWHKLEDAGIDADFVGSQLLSSENQFPADFDFDQNHEGHTGFTTAQIKAQIASWAGDTRPDVVLIHLGTNDIRFGVSANTALNNLAGIIDILRSINPDVKIVLSKVIPAGDANPGAIESFNDGIPGLVAQKNTAQSPVIVVDQYTGFDLAVDTDDNLHPNDAGDRLMADRWYAALAPLLD